MAKGKTPTRRPSQAPGPTRRGKAAPLPSPSPEEAIAQALHAPAALAGVPDVLLAQHHGPTPGTSGSALDNSGPAPRVRSDEPLAVAAPSPVEGVARTAPGEAADTPQAEAPVPGTAPVPTPSDPAPLTPAAGPPSPIYELQRSILDFYQQSAVAGLSFWTSLLRPPERVEQTARDSVAATSPTREAA